MKNEGGGKLATSSLFILHSSLFILHSNLHLPVLDVQSLRGAGREAATIEIEEVKLRGWLMS